MKNKKIKINDNLLSEVLGQVMIPPSIIKHLKGGAVYAMGQYWDPTITQKETFTRRKVIRLIRRFYRTHQLVVCDNMSFWTRRDINVTFKRPGGKYIRTYTKPYKYIS